MAEICEVRDFVIEKNAGKIFLYAFQIFSHIQMLWSLYTPPIDNNLEPFSFHQNKTIAKEVCQRDFKEKKTEIKRNY